MTRRMSQAIAAAVILAVGTGVIVAMYARRHLIGATTEQPEPVSGVCHPEDLYLPMSPGWPRWDTCQDSIGFHTCWRKLEHTGRHCEWDLATGQVTAVWPCRVPKQIAATAHQAAA